MFEVLSLSIFKARKKIIRVIDSDSISCISCIETLYYCLFSSMPAICQIGEVNPALQILDVWGDNATKCCLPTCKQFECGEGFLPYTECAFRCLQPHICLYCRQCYCPNMVRPACDIIDSGRGEKDNVTSQSNTACCMPVFASAECQSSLNDIPIGFKIAHVLVDVQYVDYLLPLCWHRNRCAVDFWIQIAQKLSFAAHVQRRCNSSLARPVRATAAVPPRAWWKSQMPRKWVERMTR